MKNFPVLAFVAVTALAAGFLIGEKHAASRSSAGAKNSPLVMAATNATGGENNSAPGNPSGVAAKDSSNRSAKVNRSVKLG